MTRGSPLFVPCDPLTGGRLDPSDHLATDAYHPGDELAALVRARDGRCRFPGCSIAARSCDLDHVRPWPIGRTAARNLLTLCRRHHRIKQRPGWRLRLSPDGTATWSDPTGRERTTAPLNALQSLVLPVDSSDDPVQVTTTLATDLRAQSPAGRGPTEVPGSGIPDEGLAGAGELMAPADTYTGGGRQAWSAIETHHVLRLEHHPHQRADHDLWTHPTRRRCTSAANLRAGFAHLRAGAPVPDLPPF